MDPSQTEVHEDDLALDVVEAGAVGLALLVPPASLLAFVLSKIERSRAKRQRELLTTLADNLEQVRERVDSAYVQSEEFEALVEEVIEKGVRRKELDKRDYYTALLANAALPGRPSPNELEAMVDTLETLRKPHLWLLAALLRPYEWKSEPNTYGSSFRQEFEAVSGVAWTEVERDWRVLEQEGLVGGLPTGIMTGSGARNFRGHVTERGALFHQFVVLPYSDVHPPT